MKIIKIWSLILILVSTWTLISCENDGDIIYTSGADDITLSGNSSDIVLSVEDLDALALTLYWNDNGKLVTSDSLVKAPNEATQNIIELSASSDFSTIATLSMNAGVYEYQFTCRELNTQLTKLGYVPGEKAPLYIRICGKLADNINPKYSEVLVVNVTPYKIDTTVAQYLNSNQEETGQLLYSPEDNKVYSGFIGAGAWGNWWLREGDGTIWGNDGVSGTPFVISSDLSTSWNFWYPGVSGCYYTVVDVPKNEWSALYIQSLSVSGDLNGDMIYERKTNQWTMQISGDGGMKSINISGIGLLYNASTGTDDDDAIAKDVSFSGEASMLTFNPSGNGNSISINVPAGELNLILDLNNPKEWTLTVSSESTPVEETPELLWAVGHNDGITGGWNFDSWLRLYNEDYLNYGGVLNINSLWGYKYCKEKDNWDDCWTMAEGGSANEGSLKVGGSTNIESPDPGLYVVDVSISALTYKLTPITTVHYAGLNDDWSLKTMTATEVPGVYSATIEKTAATPYGVKVIINENWDLSFGGGSGILLLHQNGFDGDNDLANGTYKLTVNLCEGTYKYE